MFLLKFAIGIVFLISFVLISMGIIGIGISNIQIGHEIALYYLLLSSGGILFIITIILLSFHEKLTTPKRRFAKVTFN